jgi:phosphoribosylamine--glycine ligase
MAKVNFLLVGSGGREHAIAEALCRNPDAVLFAYMSSRNPGIAALCKSSGGDYEIGDICKADAVAKWAKEKKIQLAFSSPDATLEAGVSDALIAAGIQTASPTREASRLEWDKTFARNLMKKYKIAGCPKFFVCKNEKEANAAIDALHGNVAVKPAGLTGGKGVKVTGYQLKDSAEAKAYAAEVLQTKMGSIPQVVIEEKLEGEEFTFQAFVDGKTVFGMPLVQDHKRALEGDIGVNTGGMGAYSTGLMLPFLEPSDYSDAHEIMKATIDAYAKESGKQFVGVLYGQFIATSKGVKVIEFNARFGDPEAMNVLAVFDGNLLGVFEGMAKGEIKRENISFLHAATVCKYLVPEGYPVKSIANQPLEIDDAALRKSGARLFFASVDEREGKIYTGSSRNIGIVGVADDVAVAEKIAEDACDAVSGKVWHRKDIGTKKLLDRRIGHMKKLREDMKGI